MNEMARPVNQISCEVCEINYILPTAACDRCQQLVSRYSTARRTAIDINLDHPVLLQINVSVHYCSFCHHYFRVQPPFMRPGAIYTNQVVKKAIASVYEDGMAIRGVPARLARDFWVEPSERSIRG